MYHLLMSLDGDILIFIQEHIRNPILDLFFTTITKLGDKDFVWILITLILLFFKKTRKIGIISVCALMASHWINNEILKNIFERVRPYDAVSGLVPLTKKPGGFSFPSGHTTSSFAAGYTMYKRLPGKWGIPILVLAIMIGLSRLYIGVHYPTDVIFGMFSGIVLSHLAGVIVDHI